MKKILVLSFYFDPDLCAGSFRCTALVKELLQQGAFVHVITTKPNRYSSFKIKADAKIAVEALRVDRIAVPEHSSGKIDQIKTFLAYFNGAKKIIKKNEYDIVFATSSRLFTAFLGARVAKSKKIPLYLDIRDLFVDTMKEVVSAKISWLLNPILKFVENYTFNSAKIINIVSDGFRPYFTKNYASIPISNFSNGIDDEFIVENEYDFRAHQNKKIVNILYAGNIGEGQGLHKIIPDIANRLKDKIRMKVIGDGGMLTALRDEIVERKIENVEFSPPVKRDTLIQEYMKTDIFFLHLNDYSAFEKVLPSKLFEYGAMKKPIWAGVSGYCKYFMEAELPESVIFEPADVDDAISKFADIKYGYINREDFINKFNRKTIMKKMAEEINELI